MATKSTNNINDNINCQIFLQHLSKLEALINKSVSQKNAGLYLYKNDARTVTFMLQSLCRFYVKQHNKKRFTKMLERFKFLEDSFGQIDYFSAIATSVGKGENDVLVKKYCEQQVVHHASILHAHTLEKWTGKESYFTKTKEKLQSADWQDSVATDAGIKKFYAEEITKITDLITNCKFEHMEEDVHEIRRKLRWLSIYPQALQGKIQLVKDTNPKLAYKPFMTKAILSSAFNKLPLKGKHTSVVKLYAPALYALSFVIDALGTIKDNGLTQIGYSMALVGAKKVSPAQASKEAKIELGAKAKDEKVLLLEAKNLCAKFMKSGALKALVIEK